MPRGYDMGYQRHPSQNYKSYVLNQNSIYRQTIPQIRFNSTGFVVLSHHINYLPTNISWAPIMFQMCECVLSHFRCVWLCATLWTVACQAPLPMGFSRQAYWSELPCPPPGDLPNPGIKPMSLACPALTVDSLPLAPPGKSMFQITWQYSKDLEIKKVKALLSRKFSLLWLSDKKKFIT